MAQKRRSAALSTLSICRLIIFPRSARDCDDEAAPLIWIWESVVVLVKSAVAPARMNLMAVRILYAWSVSYGAFTRLACDAG